MAKLSVALLRLLVLMVHAHLCRTLIGVGDLKRFTTCHTIHFDLLNFRNEVWNREEENG